MSDMFDWWYRRPTTWSEAVYMSYRLMLLLLAYLATLLAAIFITAAIVGYNS